jgi:hypothetical protein
MHQVPSVQYHVSGHKMPHFLLQSLFIVRVSVMGFGCPCPWCVARPIIGTTRSRLDLEPSRRLNHGLAARTMWVCGRPVSHYPRLRRAYGCTAADVADRRVNYRPAQSLIWQTKACPRSNTSAGDSHCRHAQLICNRATGLWDNRRVHHVHRLEQLTSADYACGNAIRT